MSKQSILELIFQISSKIEVERREHYHFHRLWIQLRNVLTRNNM